MKRGQGMNRFYVYTNPCGMGMGDIEISGILPRQQQFTRFLSVPSASSYPLCSHPASQAAGIDRARIKYDVTSKCLMKIQAFYIPPLKLIQLIGPMMKDCRDRASNGT